MVREHGFSLSHYQKLERGTLDPRLSTLRKLADSFGATLAEPALALAVGRWPQIRELRFLT